MNTMKEGIIRVVNNYKPVNPALLSSDEQGTLFRRARNPAMTIRIGCMYSDDWDFSDYEEGKRIRIDPNAISANFMIHEDEDQDEALDGREGELSKSFDYELHDGQHCAIVDGEFVSCEDEDELEYYLRKRDGGEV